MKVPAWLIPLCIERSCCCCKNDKVILAATIVYDLPNRKTFPHVVLSESQIFVTLNLENKRKIKKKFSFEGKSEDTGKTLPSLSLSRKPLFQKCYWLLSFSLTLVAKSSWILVRAICWLRRQHTTYSGTRCSNTHQFSILFVCNWSVKNKIKDGKGGKLASLLVIPDNHTYRKGKPRH